MEKYKTLFISVIVPIYNIENYIEECLNSIINQTYKDIEIIIVDDGSTDNSYKICKQYEKKDHRIKLIHQENRGVVSARKTGIKNATGEYIAFVDGDDFIEKDMYENMIKEISNSDLVSCGIKRYNEEGSTVIGYIKDSFENKYYDEIELKNVLRKMIFDFHTNKLLPLTPSSCNKLFKHSIIDKFYYGLDNRIINCEDFIFNCYYVLNCKAITFIDDCFYNYRLRNNSKSNSTNENMLENINLVYKKLKKTFETSNESEILIKQLQKYIQIHLMLAVNKYLGFDKSIRIPEFIIDTENLLNKKIVLYGFGQMGQDVYWQLSQFNYDITLVVDKNYTKYEKSKIKVEPIEKIFELRYDIILVAVSEEKMANEIKKDLIDMGIEAGKIIWRKPVKIY